MMQTFRTEGNYRSADRLSPAELRAAKFYRALPLPLTPSASSGSTWAG